MDTKTPDRDYYTSADPFFCLRAAIALDAAREKRPSLRITGDNGTDYFDHPTLVEIERNYEKSLAVHLHWLRLQQSETTISLLCAGKPHDPFYRFVGKFRFKTWNDILGCLAQGNVPAALALRNRARDPLNFRDWVRYKLFGTLTRDLDVDNLDGILHYVVEEAQLISNRDVVNAVKHGTRVSPASAVLSMQPSNGDSDWKRVLTIEGIRWGGWDGRSGNETYIFGNMGIDSKIDLSRIFFGALLAKAIMDIRIAELNCVGEFSVQIPSGLIREGTQNNLTLRVNFRTEGPPA